MDLRRGLVCSLTGEWADFEGDCPDYELDPAEEMRKFELKMEAAGDGESGDPINFQQNKDKGLFIFFAGLAVTIFSHLYANSIGFSVITYGAMIFGLILYFRGREQEKIYKEHTDSKHDEHKDK